MTNHKHSLEQMMKSPRNLPWLAGAVVACAVLAAPAARAQTITTFTTAPTSTTGSTPPASQPVGQTVGVVTLAPLPSTTAPEPIVASGTGTNTVTVSIDPNGGIPIVEVLGNLENVGLKGTKSLQAYHTTGWVRATRQLAAADTYTATLPIWTTSAAGKTAYYTMTATFSMTFNTTTNVCTGLTVALGDYVAPASAGGVAIGGAIQ